MTTQLPKPPFVVTTSITHRRDEFFIEVRLEDGSLYRDTGPFDTFDEAKLAYDDLMENILSVAGAQIITYN